MTTEDGVSLPEAVVSLLLGLFLVAVTWSLIAQQRTTVSRIVERADWLTTVRIARGALRRDLASAAARPLLGTDTAALRALRGWALPCAAADSGASPKEGSVAFRYRGIRAPDPRKDSVRLVNDEGVFRAVPLLDAWPEPDCDGIGGDGYWFLLDGPRGSPRYLELFERGGYHLQAGALRYRSAGGYRQPLTPENVDSRSSFGIGPARLRLYGAAVDGEWTLSLPGGGR